MEERFLDLEASSSSMSAYVGGSATEGVTPCNNFEEAGPNKTD